MRLFRAPIWCPLGGGVTREARGTVLKSLVERYSTRKRVAACTLEREGTIFCEGGGQLDRRRARGIPEPLKIKSTNREVLKG